MTAEECERIAKFVQAVNAAEREYRVRIDLEGYSDCRYILIAPQYAHTALAIEPFIGNGELTLVRSAKPAPEPPPASDPKASAP